MTVGWGRDRETSIYSISNLFLFEIYVGVFLSLEGLRMQLCVYECGDQRLIFESSLIALYFLGHSLPLSLELVISAGLGGH